MNKVHFIMCRGSVETSLDSTPVKRH